LIEVIQNRKRIVVTVWPPSALPGISPTGGEIGNKHVPCLIRNVKDGRAITAIDLPTCGGDARQGRGGKPQPPMQA